MLCFELKAPPAPLGCSLLVPGTPGQGTPSTTYPEVVTVAPLGRFQQLLLRHCVWVRERHAVYLEGTDRREHSLARGLGEAREALVPGYSTQEVSVQGQLGREHALVSCGGQHSNEGRPAFTPTPQGLESVQTVLESSATGLKNTSNVLHQ